MIRKTFGIRACLVLLILTAAALLVLVGCGSPALQNQPAQAEVSQPANQPIAAPAGQLEVNVLGRVAQFDLDDQGRLIASLELASTDGTISLSMPSGASALDPDNKPLTLITATADPQAPASESADVMGRVYDIAPVGAHFSPQLELTIAYAPAGLPAGVSEADVWVATYQDSVWQALRFRQLDTANHTVTTTITEGGRFAVLVDAGTGLALAAPNPQPAPTPPETQPATPLVSVVVAGYLNHGPMQPTVRAIKEVLDNYGDKVDATWIDLGTKDGVNYFKENNLSAHMNVIINGKYTYDVNGKEVTFQWFEGGQWTSQDLDTVIANLLSG
jgi:hypothetical protein